MEIVAILYYALLIAIPFVDNIELTIGALIVNCLVCIGIIIFEYDIRYPSNFALASYIVIGALGLTVGLIMEDVYLVAVAAPWSMMFVTSLILEWRDK